MYDYRSSYQDWKNPEWLTMANISQAAAYLEADGHYRWHQARDAFVLSGDEADKEKMLRHVTLHNPPLAEPSFTDMFPDPAITSSDIRRWEPFDFVSVGLLVVTAIAVAGVIGGWQSVVGVIISLIVVLTIGWVTH